MAADDETEELDPDKIAIFEKMMGVSGRQCEQLGLGRDFIFRSVNCSDREFIIRMHSILDRAISNILFSHCFVQKFLTREFIEGISEFCDSLSFDGKIGKLKLIEFYGLAQKRTITFLAHMNRLRNKYVHKIDYMNLDIDEVISRGGMGLEFKRFLLISDLKSGFQPENSAQFRLVIALSVAAAIWEIDHFAKSGLSLPGRK